MYITMAHGSGGLGSKELIDQIITKHLGNEYLLALEDAAVISLPGTRIAFSTDSFVVTPLFFKGADIGKLAICGTVNDLAMQGSIPKYLTLSLILETGLPLDTLEKIIVSLSEEAKKAKVLIVAGDTKVIEGSGGLIINTAGIGVIPSSLELGSKMIKKGDKIIVSGPLGNHHAALLSTRMNIENGIQSDCCLLHEMAYALSTEIKLKALRDITRGGLGTVLNEMAEKAEASMRIYQSALPLDEEVQAFCEILGLDPLYMGNEGKLVAFVEGDDADKAVAIMQQFTCGKGAKIIGEVEALQDNFVTLVTPLGGERIIPILSGEGLPRIC
jgi:hydrogenase expression/formation protein HypE